MNKLYWANSIENGFIRIDARPFISFRLIVIQYIMLQYHSKCLHSINLNFEWWDLIYEKYLQLRRIVWNKFSSFKNIYINISRTVENAIHNFKKISFKLPKQFLQIKSKDIIIEKLNTEFNPKIYSYIPVTEKTAKIPSIETAKNHNWNWNRMKRKFAAVSSAILTARERLR